MPVLMKHVDPNTHLMTDEAGQYIHLARWFMAHDFTTNGKGEYVRSGYIHTNNVEGFHSVFKRGMGAFTSIEPSITCTAMLPSSTFATTTGCASESTTQTAPTTRCLASWASASPIERLVEERLS